MTSERVYSVWDYHDGVRSGFADYHGAPHHFESVWDPESEEFTSTYTLTIIPRDALAEVLEQEGLWRAWETRFRAGEVGTETHPGLPGNDARFVELQTRLRAVVAAGAAHSFRARAEFAPARDPVQPSTGAGLGLRVSWRAGED